MRMTYRSSLALAATALLGACTGGGLLGRDRPDEFAVQRQAPLVVPPDFALTPPQPGAPRPAEGTAAQQALQALFGGPAPRSAVETSALNTNFAKNQLLPTLSFQAVSYTHLTLPTICSV